MHASACSIRPPAPTGNCFRVRRPHGCRRDTSCSSARVGTRPYRSTCRRAKSRANRFRCSRTPRNSILPATGDSRSRSRRMARWRTSQVAMCRQAGSRGSAPTAPSRRSRFGRGRSSASSCRPTAVASRRRAWKSGRLLIRLLDLERGTEEIPNIDGMNWNPVWLPDGRLSYTSMRKGDFDVYVKEVAGTGAEHAVLDGPDDTDPIAWTRDGRSGVSGLRTGRRVSTEVVRPAPPDTDHAPHRAARRQRRLPVTRRTLARLPVGHDRPIGRLRAPADHARDLPIALSRDSGEFPVFLHDGKTLALVRGRQLVVRSWRDSSGSFEVGPERVVAPLAFGSGWTYGAPYDVRRGRSLPGARPHRGIAPATHSCRARLGPGSDATGVARSTVARTCSRTPQERDEVRDVLRGEAQLRGAHHQRSRHPAARGHAVGGNDLGDAAHAAHHQRIAFLDQHSLNRQPVLRLDLRALVAVRDLRARPDRSRSRSLRPTCRAPSHRAPGRPRRRRRRWRGTSGTRGRVLSARGVPGEAGALVDRELREIRRRRRDDRLAQLHRVGIVDSGRLERRPQAVIRPVVRHAVQQPQRRRLTQRAVRLREARASPSTPPDR